jgi:DNA polymerase III alpha subunit
MAHVAWRVARIAAHYPAHFYAAVFDWLSWSGGGGMYPVVVYVTEAVRHSVQLVGPTVNSPWRSQAKGTTVHLGLALLRNVIHEETLRRMEAMAQERPFHSVRDLVSRVPLTDRELECLIGAGMLDPLAPSRRQARWEAQAAKAAPAAQPALLAEIEQPFVPPLGAEDPLERAAEEYAVLGFTRSVPHPLDLYQSAVGEADVLPVAQLARHISQSVTVAGIVVAARRIHTQQGTPMLFVTVCDASGVAELVLFDVVARREGRDIGNGQVICATGGVTDDQVRGITLEVQAVRVIQR